MAGREVYQLIEREGKRVVVESLELATTFSTRFWGLQFRKSLTSSEGLWLSPCSSLHTCWMRFAIDIHMFDKHGGLLGIRRTVKPWRIVFCTRGTSSIMESTAGAFDLCVGARYVFETKME